MWRSLGRRQTAEDEIPGAAHEWHERAQPARPSTPTPAASHRPSCCNGLPQATSSASAPAPALRTSHHLAVASPVCLVSLPGPAAACVLLPVPPLLDRGPWTVALAAGALALLSRLLRGRRPGRELRRPPSVPCSRVLVSSAAVVGRRRAQVIENRYSAPSSRRRRARCVNGRRRGPGPAGSAPVAIASTLAAKGPVLCGTSPRSLAPPRRRQSEPRIRPPPKGQSAVGFWPRVWTCLCVVSSLFLHGSQMPHG